MTDEQKMQAATELVRAMMRSVPKGTIRALDWWQRATTALEIAAMSSDSFTSLVSEMGRKLQIVAPQKASGMIVMQVAAAVGDDFEAFRSFCERNALYVICNCQEQSEARKAEWEAEQEAMAESYQRLTDLTEQIVETIPAKG